MLERQLFESAKQSLKFELYSNAAFLCERLLPCAQDQEEARLMLAESYSGEGKEWKAYHVLKNCQSEKCRYKMAVTCIKLKKMADAERVLLFCNGKSDISNVPNGAFGLYQLAHAQEQ